MEIVENVYCQSIEQSYEDALIYASRMITTRDLPKPGPYVNKAKSLQDSEVGCLLGSDIKGVGKYG
jgi:hypothetical protein